MGLPNAAFDLDRWRAEFDEARRPRARLDGGPLREPYRAADTAESPVRLLRAEYAIVPFANRDELTVLQDWCRQVAAGDRTGLAVAHGVGGAGKTRLALELAHRLRGEGWYAGVLPRQTDAASLASVAAPVLVVLDYADGRVTDVIATLKAVRERSGPPAVLMLTARSVEGQWLTDIVGSLNDDRHAYRRQDIHLPDTHPDTRNIYLRTVTTLRPDRETTPGLPRPPSGVRWTTLDLVLLGFVAASGTATLPPSRAELYDEVLRHEENYWCTVYRRFATDVEPERALLRRAAAVVSLLTPTEQDTDILLTAVKDLDDDPRERRVIRRTLAICLRSAPGEGLAVRPDPIGDHLLLCELHRDPALAHAALATAGEDRLEAALIALDRAGQQDAETGTGLITAIAEADTGRWRTILTVAAKQAGPALAALERLASRPDTPLPLSTLSDELPFSTLALFDLALIVDKHRLAMARTGPVAMLAELLARVSHRAAMAGDRGAALASITEAVTHYRNLAEIDPTAHLPALAMSLTNLAARLADLGDVEQALSPNQEAVDLYRKLVPGKPECLPDIAVSLTNLAGILSKLRQSESALTASQEAVARYRELAAFDPDHQPDLAKSLNNLSVALSDLGRHEQALAACQEAVELDREVAAGNPAVHLVSLATSLGNLGAALGNLGHHEQALATNQEAVELHRVAAISNPGAHAPDLAMALINLGVVLMDGGRPEPALAVSQEAVHLYRGLAASQPTVHRTSLAMALTNLGAMLFKLGQHESALAVGVDAVDLYRELAAHNRLGYVPVLSASLINLGAVLSNLGRHEPALAVCQEAVDLYREAVADNPAGYLPSLALAWTNLGVMLSNLGRHESALLAAQEAVDGFRKAAAGNPAVELPNLALSLTNFCLMQAKLGRHEPALLAGREAVDLYRTLAADNSVSYLPNLASALASLGLVLSNLGSDESALAVSNEAVDLYRELAAGNPPAYLPNLALALSNLGAVLFKLGLRELAIVAGNEAVSCYRGLVARNRTAHLANLAMALTNVSVMQAHLDHEPALAAGQEAVDLYRKAAAGNPDAYQPDLAMALTNLGTVLSAMRRHEPAVAVSQEAADLYRAAAAGNPAAHLAKLAASLTNLGKRMADLGRHEPALAVSKEAVDRYRELAANNAAAHLPDLATALTNLATVLSKFGRSAPALVANQEALTLRCTLATRNPAAHVATLTASLDTVANQLAEASQPDVAVDTWQNAIDAMPSTPARAELRAGFARWLTDAGIRDRARDELRDAALEMDSDDADPCVPTIIVGRARIAVRSAVHHLRLGIEGLPDWVTAPLPDFHVEVVDMIRQANGWPAVRAALDSNRGLVSTREFTATVAVLRALFPGDPTLDTLTRLLDEIARAGVDAFLARQQTLHARQTLLTTWLGAATWAESATFYRAHRDALAADDCRRMLASGGNYMAQQHLAILELADALPTEDVFAIVTDPSVAENSAFDAVENGDLNRLETIAAAAPSLEDRPMTWNMLMAVRLLAGNEPDQAMHLARHIAEHGTPIVRRAHAVRLRELKARRPDLNGALDLAEIIDVKHV